jgi:hypothetical protein
MLIGMTTLLRALQDATGLSRRKAFAAIREGHVTLDGVEARDPSGEYARGELKLDGAVLTASGPPARVYLACTRSDAWTATRRACYC